jgi:hypothetical protein
VSQSPLLSRLLKTALIVYPDAKVALAPSIERAIQNFARENPRAPSQRSTLQFDRAGFAFRDQAARISACRLTFAFKKHGREGFIRDSTVSQKSTYFGGSIRVDRRWLAAFIEGSDCAR